MQLTQLYPFLFSSQGVGGDRESGRNSTYSTVTTLDLQPFPGNRLRKKGMERLLYLIRKFSLKTTEVIRSGLFSVPSVVVFFGVFWKGNYGKTRQGKDRG